MLNSFPPTYQSKAFVCFLLIALIAVLVISAAGIIGWVIDFQFLRSPIHGFAPIRPITAVLFILISAAFIWRLVAPEYPGSLAWLRFTGFLASVIGSLFLVSYVLGISTPLDNFLVPEGVLIADIAGNRMPPQSALNFLLLGVALALAEKRGRLGQLGGILTVASLIVTFGAILGMLFHSFELTGISNRNTMAIAAAVSFTCLGITLVATNVECRLFALLTSPDMGGKAARTLLPVVILVPTFVGWARVIGQDLGLYGTAFGTTLSMLVLVVLMFGIVVTYSRKVSIMDNQRREFETQLSRNEEKYRDLFENSQGMICIHDVQGRLTTVNPAVLRITGYREDEIVGKNLIDFVPEENLNMVKRFLREIEHEGISEGLLPIMARNGDRLVWQYQSILIMEEGREPHVVGHATDITELLEAQEKLRTLSLTDELTRLYNRRGFLEHANQQLRLESHSGTARGLTLMFADMDGLKAINDIYGHEAGSEAIEALAGILKAAVRGADLVARWGGDEFVILAIGSPEENSEKLVERIEAAIHDFNRTSDKPYTLACSIGVSAVDVTSPEAFEAFLHEADLRMYEEKKRKKGVLALAGITPEGSAIHLSHR